MSASATSLESYLKHPGQDPAHSTYTHLLRLFERLKEPIHSFDEFEKASNFIKQNEFKLQKPLTEKELSQLKREDIPHEKQIRSTLALFAQADRLKLPMARLNSLHYDSAYLKIAGIHFGDEEAIRLDLSLKALYVRVKALRLRFWGKILGSKKDYYVAQGLVSVKSADSVPLGAQRQGQGVNYYTYWVCNNSLQEWVQLPVITPQQLRLAKLIKHIFTGELQASVKQYPIFQGKEKHLLKAQIARITHACEIVPRGLYKPQEQNPKDIDFEQTFKIPQFAELNTLQAWVHLNQYILHQGRCSYFVNPSLTQEQVQALTAQNAEKDPEVERLKAIAEDKPPASLGFESNWLLKQCGQTLTFNRVGKQEGTTACYGVCLLKNLNWPGAFAVGYSGGWTNIYVGYGMKVTQPSFTPNTTAPFQDSPNDIEQYPDPNPKKAPPLAEPPKDEVPPADPPADD